MTNRSKMDPQSMDEYDLIPTHDLEAGLDFWRGFLVAAPISLALWAAILFGLYKIARLIWPMP